MRARSTRNAATAACTVLAFAIATLSPLAVRAQAAQPAPQPPPPAPAQGALAPDNLASAKVHFEAGKNAYNAGDYPTAIAEFKQAEKLRPSPILDYNIGLANEKLGKRRVAVKYYRRYLDSVPNAPNRGEVEASIARLEKELGQAAGQPVPPAQQERPGDMPPAPPTGQGYYQPPPQQPGAPPPAYGSYDPYGQQQVQPQPVAQPQPMVKKKKSYWWVALVVIGAVALTAVIVGVAWWASTNSVVYYDAQKQLPLAPTGATRALSVDGGHRAPGTAPILTVSF